MWSVLQYIYSFLPLDFIIATPTLDLPPFRVEVELSQARDHTNFHTGKLYHAKGNMESSGLILHLSVITLGIVLLVCVSNIQLCLAAPDQGRLELMQFNNCAI